ncbi:hypothetical protein [Psychromonas sp. Urea-02u-13]|uniref:hypothetical protein n=1 Tax=Psychromonas sp. Urea-02u-13 TaxID=2058326 RepID=UPI000C330B64|nr:hypothetical protein [Psychromonas sp. Urea-02u-13]PKG37439.1 hypothetical protein CXF74_18745 [Psychromonas sp. Urea-02u-13]
MNLINISEKKANNQDALALIEAIENDFTDIDKVLIKADWVMQNAVKALQKNPLSAEGCANLIEQLNSAIHSVRNQLLQENELTSHSDKIVA